MDIPFYNYPWVESLYNLQKMFSLKNVSNNFFQKIYSNLEKLLDMCVKHHVPVLSIGIPDSGFLSHDKKARSRRDGVNSLLKEKAAELSRFVVSCFLRLVYLIIDAHRLKSRGEGCSNFCQNTGGGGGQSFQEK
jgi:hypothetical protein